MRYTYHLWKDTAENQQHHAEEPRITKRHQEDKPAKMIAELERTLSTA